MTRDTIVEEEQMCIDELRHRMKGLMSPELYEDDNVFQRFLRARNYNLDDAEAMLKKHLKWRKAYKVDEPDVKDYKACEVMDKYVTYNPLCYDKEGHPVLYSHFGALDTKGLLRSIKRDDMCKYIISHLQKGEELIKAQSKKLNKPIHQWVWIYNYEDFDLSSATNKLTLDCIIEYLCMYEANYPERLKVAYLINASSVFTICWSVLKPFIPKNTVKKVSIFGKEGWQEDLRKRIDPDVLPKFLGGNLTDPDGNPRCPSIVKFGGQVPESYYLRGPDDNLPFRADAKRLIVNRLGKSEVPIDVVKAGSTIEWEYDVKSRDIDFSVVYKSGNEKYGKEIVGKQKGKAGLLESGKLKCNKPGKYYLEFDNSYCWVSSKEILYFVRVTNPEDKEVVIENAPNTSVI